MSDLHRDLRDRVSYSEDRKAQKLAQLADNWGLTINELMEEAALDSCAPAICMNLNCDYSTEMEPDQDQGYCEACGSNTVQSAAILAGLV